MYLRYILGIEENQDLNANHRWGSGYHIGIQRKLERQKRWDYHVSLEIQNSNFNLYNILKMVDNYDDKKLTGDPEVEFSETFTYRGVDYKINGMIDVLGSDYIVDHKGKGREINVDQVRDELTEDLQMNVYVWASQKFKVYYNVCHIPERMWFTPNLHHMTDEQASEFLFEDHNNRMHHFPIKQHWNYWNPVIPKTFSPYQNDFYMETTVGPIIQRIDKWYDHVTQPEFNIEDPKFYNDLFYKIPVRNFDPALTPEYKTNFYLYHIHQEPLSYYPKAKHVFNELPSTQE
jgi:hypothetical protein